MTATIEPSADVRAEIRRLQAAVDRAEHARAVYAARLNAAGTYVLTVCGLTPRARRQLLALLYGHREQD